MEIMIIGASKVGINLAERLLDIGEDIVIIEKSAEKLSQTDHLDCSKVLGMALDIEVLEQAGINNVDAVCCTTDNENMNVTLGELVRTIYDKENVIISIDNEGNEALYQGLGLQTVCSTSLIIDNILSFLDLSPSVDSSFVLGFPIQYKLRKVTEAWQGVSVNDLETRLKVHVLAVLANDKLNLVSRDYILKADQNIIIVDLPELDSESKAEV